MQISGVCRYLLQLIAHLSADRGLALQSDSAEGSGGIAREESSQVGSRKVSWCDANSSCDHATMQEYQWKALLEYSTKRDDQAHGSEAVSPAAGSAHGTFVCKPAVCVYKSCN